MSNLFGEVVDNRTPVEKAKLDYRVNVTLQEEWTDAGNHKMYYEVRVLKVMLDN